MKILTLPVVALAALLMTGSALAADPAPTARWSTTYQHLTLPAGFQAMTVVVDFPPGAVFPLHSHGGPVVALVIEGEVTLVQNGTSTVYTAGQGFNEPVGQIHEARNLGSVKAVVVATYLLPKGAKPDIFVGP